MTEHRNSSPEGKMIPTSLLLISLVFGTEKGSVCKVSTDECLKAEVNMMGLRENGAENASGGFLTKLLN